MLTFQDILAKFRSGPSSEHHKGDQFERLMKRFLKTDPTYAPVWDKVWLWNEFPFKDDFGGKDIGIDLVASTKEGEYWAIQCKCYAEDAYIDKGAIDSFIATAGKHFKDEDGKTTHFVHSLILSTSNNWSANAELAIQNQTPAVSVFKLGDFEASTVDWDELFNGKSGDSARQEPRELRDHQKTALDNAHEHFKTTDRGKLIMACGTGKTFTSLRIAEKETGKNGLVLFMVPSIALLGQSLREWTNYSKEAIHAICVCSDSSVSKKKTVDEDGDDKIEDLALPASTNTKEICKRLECYTALNGLTVVFSTYQSIDVIIEAQKKSKKEFDLIICDEAHRTTGVSLKNEKGAYDESAFVKIHDNGNIRGKKRIYMTATPRLYREEAKEKAKEADAILCSMDDAAIYGEEFYRIGFGEAVEKDLLSDYKVLILTVSEEEVTPAMRSMLSETSEINTQETARIVGCINALSKRIIGDSGITKETDPSPMRMAVAFCASIKKSKDATRLFNACQEIYYDTLTPEAKQEIVHVASDHVDGSMSAQDREKKLSWLKEKTKAHHCRILTNARCLSEGVDVPSLDAVMFLSAKNSQVDVVQSVGRVMRKAPGKKYGYIIIPVVVPSFADAEAALDDNERYKVVWAVLNALRAHDERFDALINKIELNNRKITGKGGDVVIGRSPGIFSEGEGEKDSPTEAPQISIPFLEYQGAIYARMVKKVGQRQYWEHWAASVAKLAQEHIIRINKLIKKDSDAKVLFQEFIEDLRRNINDSINESDAVEMLAQHIITQPVFNALFENYEFSKNNPISRSMQTMLNHLELQGVDSNDETLEKFYRSVKNKASDVDNAEGKQRIIIELYDKFFKTAFPKVTEKLGIVYTPVEVVDFIIRSVADVLQKEFGRSIADENVHVLDPFTGTGTFMVRLIQSGLIPKEALKYKYKHDLHANEIVLLAYYIASVNIENAYHDIVGDKKYVPFDGICLTDTFQLGETGDGDFIDKMFPENSKRVSAQKKAPLRIIIGNPPYSVGQKSANDNAQNQSYQILEDRISKTYAAESTATLKNSLYDSYIKAFRWSSDRLDSKNGGIIAFVSNGGWLDGNAMDGFRKCLEKEFSSIYVFDLRGNQRTSGELSRKEGGKIFGSGSRTPIAITLLVKNPSAQNSKANIFYHDIGDYLNREEKLQIIHDYRSVSNGVMEWKTMEPDEHGDWLSQRNADFGNYIPLSPEIKFDNASKSFFEAYSNGIKTNRDAWVYGFSKNEIKKNMIQMIEFYDTQRKMVTNKQKSIPIQNIESLIDADPTRIAWTVNLKKDLYEGKSHSYNSTGIREASYRPFCKEVLYFDKPVIERPGLSNRFFPSQEYNNLVICVSGIGVTKEFSCIITNILPDFELIGKSQCFPLYYYEESVKANANDLFADEQSDESFTRKNGISRFILDMARERYGHKTTREDVFYYVYGFLHSPEYRVKYSADLKKMLPRIPLVEKAEDFQAFSAAGRRLAELHVNYENMEPCKTVAVTGIESGNFHVDKMRFPKKDQKDTILYNSSITVTNIPAEAYEYVVNGKSAIEWIMERYQITVHKESQIKNDPNDWAKEHNEPRYILDLLLKVIQVSVESVKIVRGLPKFEG